MKKLLQLLFLFLIFLPGCNSRHEPDPFLLEIKELLLDSPDSALTLLNELQADERFDKFNRSYYYILLTEARNKNGISLMESDSLVDLALDYFGKNDSPELLAEAYLWKGRIWKECKAQDQAVPAYLEGIKLLENRETGSDILSKLYDELGNAYLYESLPEKALVVFRTEYEQDKIKGEKRDLAFSLRNIGSAYDYMYELDSALFYYEEALKMAKQSRDSVYLSDVINNDISVCYKRNEEYNKALLQLEKLKNLSKGAKFNKASLFIYFNELDSASSLLKSIDMSTDIYMRTTGNLYFSQIESGKRDYKKAYQYYKTYTSQLDTIYEQDKASELEKIDRLYNIEKESIQLKNQYRTRNLILFFFAIAAISALSFIFIIRAKKKELAGTKREKELLETEKRLFLKEKEIEDLSDQISLLTGDIQRLKENERKNSREITEKENEIQLLETEIVSRRFRLKLIYEQLKQIEKNKSGKLTEKQLSELEHEIQLSFQEYIAQIRKEYPAIKNLDVLILCLRKLDFSSASVGHFFSLSANAIRQRELRLKKTKM